jgi:molybdate transport system ATP-binding protein
MADVMARLDLPTARGEGAGVVLDATVAEHDAQWQLTRLAISPGFSVWARDTGLPLGQPVRVRLLARDVSLTREQQTGTSIGNQLHGVVEAIAEDEHSSLALVRVRVGASPLVARLTRRSAHALDLQPGMPIWAQVKTVALME